jgi:hypothetical protein
MVNRFWPKAFKRRTQCLHVGTLSGHPELQRVFRSRIITEIDESLVHNVGSSSWIGYCTSAANSPFSLPNYSSGNVSEACIWSIHFYPVHQLLNVVIHESPQSIGRV